MRIRSIRPEFWRSRDITQLSIEDRLLFIGLWSYVDDNGVGLDDEASVVGDLFAADMFTDARETVARVSRGLQKLAESNLITRYEVAGKRYLQINTWAKHQRIDKPGKSRYPSAEAENADIRESVARLPEIVAPGEGEKGRRGEGEKYYPPTPPASRGERGERIPDPFIVTNEMRAWAAEEAPHIDVDAVTRTFVDYWRGVPGVKGKKLDWLATWRNWVRRDAESRAPRARVTRDDENLAVVARLAARERDVLEISA